MSHVSPLYFSPFGISGLSFDSPFLFLLFFCLVLLLFLSFLVVVAMVHSLAFSQHVLKDFHQELGIFIVVWLLLTPEWRPGMSDVSILSGNSGLSFFPLFPISSLVCFCLFLLLFLSCHFFLLMVHSD